MKNIFSFTGARKIVFGSGSFEDLAQHVQELRGSKALVVLDKYLSEAGFRDEIAKMFEKGKVSSAFFDKIEGEPALELADEGAETALKEGCDIVVGIGGGSAMDVAKAVAIIVTNGGKAEDYLGLNKVQGPGLPTIMIPTTAGTGSEVTFTAVFIRKALGKKEGMNSPWLYPDLALLDPTLTLSLPPEVTAATGIDALCHAIESYTSINSSSMSEMVSLEAIRLISSDLRTCVHDGSNLEARENLLLGSLYAGLGLANAGVTAVHSLSYPLGGKYGISHGVANTVLLPYVMRYNLPGAMEKFAIVAEAMGEVIDDLSIREAADQAVEAVEALIVDCDMDIPLEALGIKKEDFPDLAKAAMTVARPLENNPRKVTVKDAVDIYSEAY
jgi:alcohol dehydrogenase